MAMRRGAAEIFTSVGGACRAAAHHNRARYYTSFPLLGAGEGGHGDVQRRSLCTSNRQLAPAEGNHAGPSSPRPRLEQRNIVRMPKKAGEPAARIVVDGTVLSVRTALKNRDQSGALRGLNALRQVAQLDALTPEDVRALCSTFISSENEINQLVDDTVHMRAECQLAVLTFIFEQNMLPRLLQVIPKILRTSKRLRPEQVQSIVHLACLAAIGTSKQPDSVVARLFNFDASHLYLDQQQYDARKSVQRLGWCQLPASAAGFLAQRVGAFGLDAALAGKVYRHAVVALCIAMNRSAETDNLIQSIRRSFDSDHLEAIKMLLQVFEEAHGGWLQTSYMEGAEAIWGTRTWSALLRGLIAKHQLPLAQTAWETLNRCKPADVDIPSPIWNALLTGYADIGDWDRAGQVWALVGEKSQTDNHLITTMISTLFKARRPHEAILLFDQVKERCAERKQVLDVAVVNAYLFGLTYNDHADLAMRLLMDMSRQDDATFPTPNSRSFNTALRAIGRHGTLENVTSILGLMAQSGVRPDAVTFTTVLDALARLGVSDSLPDVYSFMQRTGVRLNEVTMTTMVKSSLDKMDEDPLSGLLSALELLRQMETSGPTPTAVTYTAVMTAVRKDPQCVLQVARSEQMPSSYGFDEARKLLGGQYNLDLERRWAAYPTSVVCLTMFERMKCLRIEPNRKTLHSLIHTFIGEDAAEMCSDELLREGFVTVIKLFDRVAEPSRPTDKTALMLVDRILAVANAGRVACKPEMSMCLDILLEMCNNDERVRNALPNIIHAAKVVQRLGRGEADNTHRHAIGREARIVSGERTKAARFSM